MPIVSREASAELRKCSLYGVRVCVQYFCVWISSTCTPYYFRLAAVYVFSFAYFSFSSFVLLLSPYSLLYAISLAIRISNYCRFQFVQFYVLLALFILFSIGILYFLSHSFRSFCACVLYLTKYSTCPLIDYYYFVILAEPESTYTRIYTCVGEEKKCIT